MMGERGPQSLLAKPYANKHSSQRYETNSAVVELEFMTLQDDNNTTTSSYHHHQSPRNPPSRR